MKTYKENTYWKKYQDFLPETLHYPEAHPPGESYWLWNGFQVHIDRMEHIASPCKIILLHGAGGNGRIVGLFGNYLCQQGFEYIAPDLMGYGLTQNPENKDVNYDLWVSCISDLIDLESAKDNRPIVLFGLSVGGMLAYQVAAKNKQIRKIIVTTMADPRSKAVQDSLSRSLFLSRVGIPLMRVFYPLTDLFSMPVKWLCKMDQITNNPDFSQVFMKDPLAGGSWMKLSFLKSYLNYTPETEPEDFKQCEVLYLQPEKDNWTTLKTSMPFFERISAQKKMVLLENCGHAPYEQPGLTTMQQEVITFLLNGLMI